MASKVVAIYALPLALLSLILGVRGTLIRTSLKVSVGDAGHPALRKCNRQHGNLVERAPWVALLMPLAKVNGAGAPWLHASGALQQAGRLIRPVYLKAGNAAWSERYIIGNTASLLAVLMVMGCLLCTLFGG